MAIMSDDIRDNAALRRFELDAGGHTAVSHYQLAAGIITFTHTEVAPALRGRGIGARLVRGALDAARARGLRVKVQCPFVSEVIERHPEYADLLLD